MRADACPDSGVCPCRLTGVKLAGGGLQTGPAFLAGVPHSRSTQQIRTIRDWRSIGRLHHGTGGIERGGRMALFLVIRYSLSPYSWVCRAGCGESFSRHSL